jgi:hypothetical protein
MDAVITRIIEIEKQSALKVAQAEEAGNRNIEAHRLILEQKKESTHAGIISEENSRLTQALEALKKRTEAASAESGKEYESRFHNPALVDAIKIKILDILLKR